VRNWKHFILLKFYRYGSAAQERARRMLLSFSAQMDSLQTLKHFSCFKTGSETREKLQLAPEL